MIGGGDLGARVYDLCIVGAGAAGLSLAAEFAATGLHVLVLEAGGLKATKASRRLFEGDLVDSHTHPALDAFRVRAVGGASRIWGGRVVPFDPADFADRPWVAGPGWPFPLETLTPFYVRAQVAAEAGAFDYAPASVLPGHAPELVAGLDGGRLLTRLERFSKPTNFWTRFGPALRTAARVHVALDSPATAIRLTADGRAVDHIEILRDGVGGAVRARRYVLALGGLETARLMMASNDVKPQGVGGDHDHLGRYYMSHITGVAGAMRLRPGVGPLQFGYVRDAEGVYVRRRLLPTAAAQAEMQSLNIAFRTGYPDPADPAHGDPVLSAMFLVKDLITYEYARKMREGGRTVGDHLAHVRTILRHPLEIARFGTHWALRRTFAVRKLPSVVRGSSDGAWPLEFHAEQAPNADSRVELSDKRDALGVPRLRVDWRMTPLDVESVQRSFALLDCELRRTGLGVVDFDPDVIAQVIRKEGAYGGHHLGTARMAANPRDGVLDPDLRVHGVPNLFVASTAAFPTSSQANPTLTLLALAIRLADRLKAELSEGGGELS
jgi:choline dehydrogenase-like flavoprotein